MHRPKFAEEQPPRYAPATKRVSRIVNRTIVRVLGPLRRGRVERQYRIGYVCGVHGADLRLGVGKSPAAPHRRLVLQLLPEFMEAHVGNRAGQMLACLTGRQVRYYAVMPRTFKSSMPMV